MHADADVAQPEREQTDESLRAEREKADVVLSQGQVLLQAAVDRAADRARQRADAAVSAARDTADEKLAAARPGEQACEIVAEERLAEDHALRAERAAAEQALRSERAEHALTLARLLPLERERTDGYLLTERARADRVISNRDQFLSMVSHDLRNLLQGVTLGSRLIADEVAELGGRDEESVIVQTAQRIQRASAQMNRLLRDLVDVSSIEAGKLAVAATPGEARSAIVEAVETFQLAATAKGLALVTEPGGPPLHAIFDRDRILQVLGNVISNAIKFTPPGGEIWVTGAPADDLVRLSVRDTGPGIPAPLLEAVFERFWQLAENDQRGMGLGLYICRCILEAHGGRIWAESTLGAGSTFHVTLPAAPLRSAS